jgi:hypothetical protein
MKRVAVPIEPEEQMWLRRIVMDEDREEALRFLKKNAEHLLKKADRHC